MRRIPLPRPHQLVLSLGVLASLGALASGIVPRLTGWEDDSPISRHVFDNVPDPLYWAFYATVGVMLLVVAWLISRLRALGWTDNRSLLASAVLRGSYHLYQGFGAGVGNLVMGLIFGRYFQRTGRLWPLVIAHALIDIVAFVGFAALRDHVSWLPG